MADALDLEPVTLRVNHAPPGEVVDRRSPEHGLFTARVHGDVAANTGRIDRGRIDGKDKACALGGLGDATCHDARFGVDRGDRARVSVLHQPRECPVFDG